MLWGLLGSTAAIGVVSSANVEQVGLVVSMAQLELIESTGCLSPGAWGNPESFPMAASNWMAQVSPWVNRLAMSLEGEYSS